MKVFRSKYGGVLAVVLAVAAVYALLTLLFGITCPIKYVLGISCPGCGMTRACLHALKLDFPAAFAYHPLWVMMPPLAVACAILYKRRKRRAMRLCLGIAALALCVAYAWRLAAGNSEIVVFAPQNGLIGRAVRAVFGGTPG